MGAQLSGTYILVISLQEPTRVTIGRRGEFLLQPGYYLYVGSALNGLEGRLARHLRQEKRLHWHIDYLLQVGQIEEIWYSRGTQRRECDWASALSASSEVCGAVAHFGTSDCTCGTHLFYAPVRPCVDMYRGVLPGAVQTISDIGDAPSLGPDTLRAAICSRDGSSV